eukprot:TRINITY_DN8447_c0_g1_i4.p2 TRINITY_DN8447_c0_g1~~TRINITY_DN8447_c0_g1_i4.p2  ORF type:complete len:322 (+),score=48.74 TRINITY_DN8447_c0_g1_i4:62-1027(+)
MAVIAVLLLLAASAVHQGERSVSLLSTPTNANLLLDAIENVLPHVEGTYTDARIDAFNQLRRCVIRSADAEIGEQVRIDQAAEVLKFLLNIYEVSPFRRRQVEEVLQKLLRSHMWADSFVDVLSSRTASPLLSSTQEFLKLDELVESSRLRRAQKLQQEEHLRKLESIRAIPSYTFFTHAVDEVLTMQDIERYENGAEVAFSKLRTALLRTRKLEDIRNLLNNVDEEVPSATWSFLLQLGGSRRNYQRQIAELIPMLLLSEKWAQALEARPGLVDEINRLPESLQRAFPATFKVNAEELDALIADSLSGVEQALQQQRQRQ